MENYVSGLEINERDLTQHVGMDFESEEPQPKENCVCDSEHFTMEDNASELGINETDLTPHVGMEFESEEHAYRFYNAYAGFLGFSVRKEWVNRSRTDHNTVLSRKLVYFKEGFKKVNDYERTNARKDLRTGCKAQMTFSRRANEKYVITSFEKEHNHVLATPRSKHKLSSQRKISSAQATQIEQADNSGIRQKLIFEFLSQQVGGRENVGCTLKDINNHLSSKRMAEMKEGEAHTLLNYFESKHSENPSFFYEIQLDVENQITNIFWADAKMIADYFYFGDMVSFDTTYRTNHNLRPFAPFVGFNHHRQTVIFGAALLYDETSESFEWLFRTFVKAMNEKKPSTIFTDQDLAMAKAITKVFPDSHHRLCTWHLMQNACKHVNHAFKKSYSFAADLKSCMCDYEYESDFLIAWELMLDKYDLHENKWLKDLFAKREKWSSVYGRHAFSAGATTTQLSESFNGRLRGYMKPTLNVLGFFKHLDRLIDDMRYKELEENYEMSQTLPSLNFDVLLLKNAREIYTRAVFVQVRKEYEKSCNIFFKECSQASEMFEYKVCVMGDKGDHKVTYNSEDETIDCSCKKYQLIGILCCHALRVLNLWNKLIILPRYILKRWTKHARSGCAHDNSGRIIEENPKLDVSNRFKDLCRTAVEISSRAAESNDAATFLAKKFVEISVEVDKILKSSSIPNQKNIGETIPNREKNAFEAKGLKKKDSTSRVKGRPKSCLEKRSKRKRQ